MDLLILVAVIGLVLCVNYCIVYGGQWRYRVPLSVAHARRLAQQQVSFESRTETQPSRTETPQPLTWQEHLLKEDLD